MKIEKRGNHEIHHPRNRLADKATPGGPAVEDILPHVEAELTAMAAQFPPHAAQVLEDMRKAVLALRQDGENSAALGRLAKAARGLTAQAASFGYPLFGQVAASLARLCGDAGKRFDKKLMLADLHVDAMKFVLLKDVRTLADPRGRDLYASLEAAIAIAGSAAA